jgi:2-hydroxychromene-2-carboxylate isomerase
VGKTLEFFFDYGSPYSYLADTQLAGLAARTGATVVYRPMLLGAVLKATGNASPITVSAKARYSGADLARWARRYGVPMRPNPYFPINTLRLMRGAVATQPSDFEHYHRAVFRAMWEEEQNLGDEAVVRGVLERAGLDGARVLARTESPEVKDRLRTHTDEAIERGVFGAPAFFVGEELFWGNDRLQFVEEALHDA